MADEDEMSLADRARFGIEALVVGLTPNPGTGPLVDQYVSEHPEAGVVRSITDMIEADTEAREKGDESAAEKLPEAESADTSDPPAGFLEGLRDIDIPWNSPYVDHIDRDDPADTENAEADTADEDDTDESDSSESE